MWILFAILCVAGVVALSVLKTKNEAKLERMRINGKDQDYSEEQIAALVEAERFPVPSFVSTGLWAATAIFIIVGSFNSVFFYAEPGYKYHVRLLTSFGGILDQERVVSDTGYNLILFGRNTPWKNEMSVQASASIGGSADVNSIADGESKNMSASMPPFKVTMLDQVDARVQATARFRLPDDPETFLNIAHKYRTPENLLRTSLIPQFQETLKATSALMSAEEYYSGGITQFQNEFETQMVSGIFVVRREEVLVKTTRQNTNSANATKGADQGVYGDGTKVTYVVNKVIDASGQPIIKISKLKKLGIEVVEVRVTDLKPNVEFEARMKLKQKASADRAIAKEQRIQQEEEKLLAIAKGARNVAERQAIAKVKQIEETTNAETTKQLVLTKASQQLEQARIDKETAKQVLLRDKIKAQSVKVLADAQAYKKREILKADNALADKLRTEVEIQKVWAAAYANRAVPQYVIGGGAGGPGGTPVGADGEVKTFMQLMTIDAAKRLNYDRGLAKTK